MWLILGFTIGILIGFVLGMLFVCRRFEYYSDLDKAGKENLTKIRKANTQKIRIFFWHFRLSIGRWFTKENKTRAKVDDIVCTRFNLYRHKGKIATVLEIGICEYDLYKKHHRDKDVMCSTLKFKNGKIAWNFLPKDYYIFKKN